MKGRECCFDRESTNIVKGMLLLLMFILHFFCFPSWYIDGIEYPNLLWLEEYQGHFQICVAGFTFLTGYLYFFKENKNFNDVMKKWAGILAPYWIVFILLLAAALITNTYTGDFTTILAEAATVEQPVMFFGWYVPYYIFMVVMLWASVKLIKNDFLLFVVSLCGSVALSYIAERFTDIDFVISTTEKFSVYFPITVAGYICAKNKIFERISELLKDKNLKIFCSALFIIVVFMEPSWLYGVNIDNVAFSAIRKCIRIVSIPLFIYGILEIISFVKCKAARLVAAEIGKMSMFMWFLHSIFFNCSREVFQKALYFPKYPIFVLIWGLAVCWIASVPLKYLSDKATWRILSQNTVTKARKLGE